MINTRSGISACNFKPQTCHWALGTSTSCTRQAATHALPKQQDSHVDSSTAPLADGVSCQRRLILLTPMWAAVWGCRNTQPALAMDTVDWAQGVAQQIERDFVDKQYYVTGNLTRELYQPECRFIDPTTNVVGVEPYTKAVSVLFDAATSKAELISIKVTSPTTILLRWRLEGTVRIGNLRIKPYTGSTVYNLNKETGLIESHVESWDISAVDAFLSTLLPNTGAPPAPPIEQLRAEAQRG